MKTFLEFVQIKESTNEVEWQRLFDHGLNMYRSGPFKDPRFHDNMVRLMRNVGLDDEANELEMVKISDEDIEFGNMPKFDHDTGLSISGVLGHKEKRKKEERFRVAHRTYLDHLESIITIVGKKGREMGWEWAE